MIDLRGCVAGKGSDEFDDYIRLAVDELCQRTGKD